MSILIGHVIFYNKEKGFGFIRYHTYFDFFVGSSVCNNNLNDRNVILFRVRDSKRHPGKQEVSEIIPWGDLDFEYLMNEMSDDDFKLIFRDGYFKVYEQYEAISKELKIKLLSKGAGYITEEFFKSCTDIEKRIILIPHPNYRNKLALEWIPILEPTISKLAIEYVENFNFEKFYSTIILNRHEFYNRRAGSGDDESFSVTVFTGSSYHDLNSHDPYLYYDFKYTGYLYHEDTGYCECYEAHKRYLANYSLDKETESIKEHVKKAIESFNRNYDKQKHQERMYYYFKYLLIHHITNDLSTIGYSELEDKIVNNEYFPSLEPFLPCSKVGITF